ncbi:orotidine-5'-phosphate decarboxylase [Thermoplasma volcanium GSS1]|uniref:Orotidine 5'-phosphate decarboxylase n=1 Tax=Thermoplasma volcanium (strain ATCC 51530 / DSM 4299 / JCM 9571 / NBRC 15438 / GSS1) TaxID=273116 RepID=PYRF_THEVO|nr:orotidine-5'-phosphate decarboxylase [Thermoplasma volcanium]Q97CS3.1 RecName: Full=Orotidine 5'-phosphate decarboxylase; AltName: Full=OMP decarboxylase; Short=OMPDCase; Short=OMPdecase [Thermoplasma volcanium GSS1]BAB59170.1 orotidine-5'-phosphate decarboxylase [Thermoplasma volcanium GSS1]
MDKRIIVALDVKEKKKAIDIAESLSDIVFAFKINWPLVLYSSPEVIGEISQYGKVICDFKVADIPYTNSLITERVRDLGAWGIISHSFLGEESLKSVVNAAKGMHVFSVVAMSHPGSDMINSNAMQLMKLSIECGVYGFVAPANKIDDLRMIRSATDRVIISPGIGAQGGDPYTAVLNGSDYLIVGRSVYESDKPELEVSKLQQTAERAIEDRERLKNS